MASDEWRIDITLNLVSDLSIYERKDYRRFLSAHFQFLIGLCQLSKESVNNSINQFLTSLFVTTELLSEKNFISRIDSLIDQSESNAPRTFVRLLSLIQNLNHGNRIISTYGTNFEYIARWYDLDESYAPTQALIYDDECSCDLHPNCTTEARFIQTNSSEDIRIKGLKMGCTPSESFRLSTLECFYDQSCFHLIQKYTNYTISVNSTNSSAPLSDPTNRFPINTTIDKLINNLFIEKWIKIKNYPFYFGRCSPLFCSYTYSQRFSLLYTITVLFGLQGGLSIVLKLICPLIVRFVAKIYQYRKRRTNSVQPISSIEMSNAENVITNVRTLTCDVESIPPNITLQYEVFKFDLIDDLQCFFSRTNSVSSIQCSFKVIRICIPLIFLVVGLTLFTIYLSRQSNNQLILRSLIFL